MSTVRRIKMTDFFINKGYAAKSGVKHDYLC